MIFLNAFRERREKYMSMNTGKKLAREHTWGIKLRADHVFQQLYALLLLI